MGGDRRQEHRRRAQAYVHRAAELVGETDLERDQPRCVKRAAMGEMHMEEGQGGDNQGQDRPLTRVLEDKLLF